MISLMVGSNYDPALPEAFARLNDAYAAQGIRIAEIYGSVQNVKVFGSARPDFRVPKTDMETFEKSIRDFTKAGILVNYTENIPIVKKSDIDKVLIKEKLDMLKSFGVGRLTIAHPLAMEIVQELSDLPIEVSTIYRANTVYQMRELKRRAPNINKMCLDVAQNRNFKLIFKLLEEGKKLGIDIELLANELCIADCADRVQCYNDHAQVSSEKEASDQKNYPMGRCTYLRNALAPVEWTRSRFILPQSMKLYESITGIDHFKITGRTHPTKYILWIVEEYLKQNYSGNLLGLWADVKNIKRVAHGHEDFLEPNFNIDSAYYGDDFIRRYLTDPMLSDLDLDHEYEVLGEILTKSLIHEA